MKRSPWLLVGLVALVLFVARSASKTPAKGPPTPAKPPAKPPGKKTAGKTPAPNDTPPAKPNMAGWVPYSPPPPAVVARAKELLVMWQLGDWDEEDDPYHPGELVRYVCELHGPSATNPQPHKGVSVWHKADAGSPAVAPVESVDDPDIADGEPIIGPDGEPDDQ